MIIIRVPCSSANIGPGFDVIGLALSIYLELRVDVTPTSTAAGQYNCTITYEGQGAGKVDLTPDHNLVTQSALYVLRCHGNHEFPPHTTVHIINHIPLGRGLGSSGAAVVAGIMLGNEVGRLRLSKDRILDYCLMIERHPDNVAAALYGGFVGTCLRKLDANAMARKEIPLSEVLPEPAGGIDTGLIPPEPPERIGLHTSMRWAPEIKAVAIIPDFEVKTADARGVLPLQYERADAIFNMQRLALLPIALGQSPPNPELIYEAMHDKMHQPYRAALIPGLTEVLRSISPTSHPGLLGICLSGAGPTILALATKDFENIAQAIMRILSKPEAGSLAVHCDWMLLEPANDGATVSGSFS